MRILGKTRLTAFCLEADDARTWSLLRVNIGDLEKVLRPEELEDYILIHGITEKTVGIRIDGGVS